MPEEIIIPQEVLDVIDGVTPPPEKPESGNERIVKEMEKETSGK